MHEQELQKIRETEEEKGYRLSDEEFEQLVHFSERKIQVLGKDDSYLPILLPDVIKEYFFRSYITGITMLRMEGLHI